MRSNLTTIIAAFALLLLFSGSVAASDQPKPTDTAAESTAPANSEKPNVVLPQPNFEFDPVVDGTEVTHDFPIKNTGKGMLAIQRVKTG